MGGFDVLNLWIDLLVVQIFTLLRFEQAQWLEYQCDDIYPEHQENWRKSPEFSKGPRGLERRVMTKIN